ncbi:uncharacterized protein LOC135122445 [Zophobas morio]|uniref:uncharacterized protein LOC135122445 n=1 Tax=Zophobas morio TaxID=2755281 RepID=UPI003082AAB0
MDLLENSRGGDALASMTRAKLLVEKLKGYYNKSSASFIHSLSKGVAFYLEKAELDNALLYHKKVPERPVDLPESQQVVNIEKFSLPPCTANWNKNDLELLNGS